MAYTIRDVNGYRNTSGTFVDLGNVSGTATADFSTYDCVKMTLTGDTVISITSPSVRTELQERQLIIDGTDSYEFTLDSSELSVKSSSELLTGIEVLPKVNGIANAKDFRYGETGCTQLRNGNLYFFSQASSEEGIFQISFSDFPNEASSSATLGLDVTTEESGIVSFYMTEDGNYLITSGTAGDGIDMYSMSTPYDLSTATFQGYSGDLGSGFYSLWMKPDGTGIFASDSSFLYEYELTTAFDITTLNSTEVQTVSSLGIYGDYKGNILKFLDSGNKMLLSTRDMLSVIRLDTPYMMDTGHVVKSIPIRDFVDKTGDYFYFSTNASPEDEYFMDIAEGYMILSSYEMGTSVFPLATATSLDITFDATAATIENVTPYKVY